MQEEWDEIIRPKRGIFDLRLKEIWKYRDLLALLVRRDFVSTYKQTLLGPVWYVFQAFFTAFAFTVVFQKIFGMYTEHVPAMLFYMSGLVCWNYFSQCLTKTSNTFVSNAGIFGKVYFPRLVVPISSIISNLIGFGIQLLFLIGIMIFYKIVDAEFHLTYMLFFVPFLILLMAIMGLGFGIIISSLSIKYRDFQHITSFGVQLLMFATPVMYPFHWIRGGLRFIMVLNPLTPIIEAFRYAFLGVGEFSYLSLTYSAVFSVSVLFMGIVMFSRYERNFIDVV